MQSPHTNLSVMKLYILIQRFLGRKYVHYFVLFFILISIAAIIGSSYEEMAAYRLPLFGVTYVSSFVFLVEYIARILSAPALYPGRKAVKARLKYTFSFYGFVDFVLCYLVSLPIYIGIRKWCMSSSCLIFLSFSN